MTGFKPGSNVLGRSANCAESKLFYYKLTKALLKTI